MGDGGAMMMMGIEFDPKAAFDESSFDESNRQAGMQIGNHAVVEVGE